MDALTPPPLAEVLVLALWQGAGVRLLRMGVLVSRLWWRVLPSKVDSVVALFRGLLVDGV
ncbi:hypothetical protein [Actinomadura chibensis]|uniref:hypothetical protein n=1 Tax=Actinomadura chibensis TaxID=392828 RepID=UPI001FE932F9|nr:hypothetical protein [Actinomadura chibensis]